MMIMDYIFLFIIGSVFGSFLNVCIYRIPKNISLIHPGSACPSCEKRIPLYHNVPILSYLLLRGRCAECKTAISMQYPLIELMTALVTIALLWKFGISPELLFYAIFSYAMIVIAAIDLNTQLIHNKVLLFVAVTGIALNFVFAIIPWLDALPGILAGGGVMLLFAYLGRIVFKKEAMGMGDVKFAAVAGFFLGWKVILVALYLGFLIALFTIIILKLISRLNTEQPIPMGPFLAGGLFVFILFGDTLTSFYLRNFVI